jgi:hypothetical protein
MFFYKGRSGCLLSFTIVVLLSFCFVLLNRALSAFFIRSVSSTKIFQFIEPERQEAPLNKLTFILHQERPTFFFFSFIFFILLVLFDLSFSIPTRYLSYVPLPYFS